MIHQSHQREEWRTETKLGSDPTILTRICDHRVLTNWDESMQKNMKSLNHKNHKNHLRITMRKSWMFQTKMKSSPSSNLLPACSSPHQQSLRGANSHRNMHLLHISQRVHELVIQPARWSWRSVHVNYVPLAWAPILFLLHVIGLSPVKIV